MSSGFVSSSQLDDERLKRQEEWEKVRKAEDPIEAPEEQVCNKSLFEQLKHNKDKKDLEVQESKALKNLIRGIDEDESNFLSMVNDIQRRDEKTKKEEEAALLEEMRNARSVTMESKESASVSSFKPPPIVVPSKSKQAALIGSIIKKKSESSTSEEKAPEEKKAKIDGGLTEGSALCVVGHIPGIPGMGDYCSDEDDDDEESTSSSSGGEILPLITTVVNEERCKTKKESDDD